MTAGTRGVTDESTSSGGVLTTTSPGSARGQGRAADPAPQSVVTDLPLRPDQEQARLSFRDEEQKSLDLVQRWVVAALITVVGGAPTAGLAVYSARLGFGNPAADVLGLWVMSAILGLLTALAVVLVHRRRGWSLLLVLVGLVPAAIAANYLFG